MAVTFPSHLLLGGFFHKPLEEREHALEAAERLRADVEPRYQRVLAASGLYPEAELTQLKALQPPSSRDPAPSTISLTSSDHTRILCR